MKKNILILLICLVFSVGQATIGSAAFTEPSMGDYTAMPIFTSQSVQPNIMIILDNSGSMNTLAYEGVEFKGEPYNKYRSFQVISGEDDGEEYTYSGTTWTNNGDFDLGGYSTTTNDSMVGLRFQDIPIPQGAVIQSAYIQFTAYRDESVATDILIEGQDSDDALPFATTVDNVKNRPGTSNTVTWSAIPAWTAGQTGAACATPDITAIVQEIVNRSGWESGNAMVFRFSGTGKRDAYTRDGSSSRQPVLHIVCETADPVRYYGYFNPDYFYSYSSNTFNPAYKKLYADPDRYFDAYEDAATVWNVENMSGVATTLGNSDIVSSGLWDGNFLNWVSMRRTDVLRKVLMGGKATSRTGGGNQHNLGEVSSDSRWQNFDTSGEGPAVSPHDGNVWYNTDDGYIRVNGNNYTLDVQKLDSIEPQDFFEGNLAGVLQRIGDKARWGNMWFNTGTGNNRSGGFVAATIGTNVTSLITDLQNTPCNTWTPLAETFYVAMQYFAQRDVAGGLDFPNNVVPNDNDGQDPYYNSDDAEFIPCAKSFVILLTDGASTMDSKIPSAFRDVDGDGDDLSCDENSGQGCDYGSYGSDYLDDLALYARTTDLRPDTESDGLEGEQNIILYNIYAFGNDPNARSLLKDAARNGGFEDRDGDGLPDGTYTSPAEERLEWDEDGDAIPDTYFEASDGYALESRLLEAITDILRRASSGTAASVLATNSEGAGNSVQAYFRPIVTVGLEEARWLGYMENLWVDPWGNLREDTNGNLELDLQNSSSQNTAEADVDLIVEFFSDSGDTMARRYTSHYLYNPDNGKNGECVVAGCDTALVSEEINMELVNPLFEAGELLSQRDPDDRKVFTYIDVNQDNSTGGDTSIDTSGEVIVFHTDMAAELAPYLGVSDPNNTDKWDAYGSSANARATNLISYIRGTDMTGMRNRTLDGTTWRLGDIVHSTPIVVARPAERYHQLYNDSRYAEFLEEFKDRETMIYVGANDGMIHAFTSWVYTQKDDDGNEVDARYKKPTGAGVPADEKIGEELWAYIPQSVLPHLKWYGLTDYTHTYYVDGEPRVFDADILPNNTHYSGTGNNYGTFMMASLGMGGKDITVNEDFGGGAAEERTFSPTYVLLDITEPRDPRVMWERSYQNLGMSYCVPAPLRVGDQWFLVFGSGPTEYDGSSSNGGYIFIVDMATGEPYGGGSDWMWGELINNGNSYFNDPLALDIFQTANADAIYLAQNYYSGGSWQSDVYKITVPCSQCPWDGYSDKNTTYYVDPSSWQLSKFFESDRPISVKLNASSDPRDNILLYFGTGRYISEDDKTDTNQQYLYGVKDPFYNEEKYAPGNAEGNTAYFHSFSQSLTLSRDDLFSSDGIEVTTSGNVTGLSGDDTNFADFANDVRLHENGWYLSLETYDPDPSERIITRSGIFGGIVLTPAYVPSFDTCGQGGDTALIGVYYETGTGYTQQIFDIDPSNLRMASVSIDGNTTSEEVVEIRDDDLKHGTPAPKVVFHVGLETGVKSKLQTSNRGEGGSPNDTALYFRNAITDWWDWDHN